MCWQKYKHTDLQRHIAETDIISTKVLVLEKNKLRAFYRKYYYAIGELNQTDFPLEMNYLGNIYEGFHSYNSENIKYVKAITGIFVNNIVRKEFIHIFNFQECNSLVVVECTIPKGSEYYENSIGEIVSDKLIINKILFKYV